MESIVHVGTHMDAPCHFKHGGQRSHEVPMDMYFGPAAVMDIRLKVQQNGDYEMTMEDVQQWEEQHGQVPDGAIVLVKYKAAVTMLTVCIQ